MKDGIGEDERDYRQIETNTQHKQRHLRIEKRIYILCGKPHLYWNLCWNITKAVTWIQRAYEGFKRFLSVESIVLGRIGNKRRRKRGR